MRTSLVFLSTTIMSLSVKISWTKWWMYIGKFTNGIRYTAYVHRYGALGIIEKSPNRCVWKNKNSHDVT